MSRMTKEINKITGTIISVSGKLIIYAVVIMLLVEGMSQGYAFGHEVFYSTSMSEAPGKDITVTIGEDTALSDVADDLFKLGLVGNKYAVIIQAYFYDYEVYPGTYVLNTSMTSKQILGIICEVPEATEESGDAQTGPEAGRPDTIDELSEEDQVSALIGEYFEEETDPEIEIEVQ